jgi:predicted ribonuclease YlaK
MPKKSKSLDLNAEFQHALELLEKGEKHVFVTGKAGTGKSTFLAYFREHTKRNIVVLAPTGVAALNVNGETIHSFFGFLPGITVEDIEPNERKSKKFMKLDTIVIDEVSMVRADLLDCVDRALRLWRGREEVPF